ncbi:hypothetical protein C8R42DRAFT_660597 [Lentinula raphanica]|nr:hypothetical protein C8R42DRAFT_660597 [Lentinula raphanica]
MEMYTSEHFPGAKVQRFAQGYRRKTTRFGTNIEGRMGGTQDCSIYALVAAAVEATVASVSSKDAVKSEVLSIAGTAPAESEADAVVLVAAEFVAETLVTSNDAVNREVLSIAVATAEAAAVVDVVETLEDTVVPVCALDKMLSASEGEMVVVTGESVVAVEDIAAVVLVAAEPLPTLDKILIASEGEIVEVTVELEVVVVDTAAVLVVVELEEADEVLYEATVLVSLELVELEVVEFEEPEVDVELELPVRPPLAPLAEMIDSADRWLVQRRIASLAFVTLGTAKQACVVKHEAVSHFLLKHSAALPSMQAISPAKKVSASSHRSEMSSHNCRHHPLTNFERQHSIVVHAEHYSEALQLLVT